MTSEVLVDVRNLVKTYGPLRAVNDLSFQVHRGQIVGLLGPNGAGKSTTMKVLTGYIGAEGGSARVAGVSVDEDLVSVQRHIGYLPENAPLYNEMRVRDFLYFIGRMRELPPARCKERVEWAVEACGLKPKFYANIETLSHGFRRRVGLAQAVLHDPDLLILDEPTSGLDPIQLVEIRRLILELGKTKTVFFSTHIMQEVEAVCNRVLLIHRGRLALDGNPRELRERWDHQARIQVRLQGAPAEQVQEALQALAGPVGGSVTAQAEVPGVACRVSVPARADEAGQVTGGIFGLARDRGWTLTQLHREQVGMEEIFLEVTGPRAEGGRPDSPQAAAPAGSPGQYAGRGGVGAAAEATPAAGPPPAALPARSAAAGLKRHSFFSAPFQIFRREMASYFSTPIGAVFVLVFLVLSGTLYVMELFVYGQAELSSLFSWMPMLFLVFVPAVAMRLWSEEKKLGTIELLMTLPVNSVQAVLGKFAAGLTFLGFTLAMTFPLPLAVFWLGNPDPGPILGGYLGSLALGMVYLSIGSFASTLSRDQIVAFIIGGVLCAFFWLTGWEPFVASISDFSQLLGAFVAALGIDTHFYGISRGVLDTRDVIYALSVTAFFLYLNVIMVERKR